LTKELVELVFEQDEVAVLICLSSPTATDAAATVVSAQDCFFHDFAYGGDDILVSGKHNVKDSPLHVNNLVRPSQTAITFRTSNLMGFAS